MDQPVPVFEGETAACGTSTVLEELMTGPSRRVVRRLNEQSIQEAFLVCRVAHPHRNCSSSSSSGGGNWSVNS